MPPRTAALAGLLLAATARAEDSPRMPYPPTRTDPVTDTVHGDALTDPYRWLEDAASPAVKAWTDDQNAHTRRYLDKLPGRDALRARLSKLTEIGGLSTPQPHKGRLFYQRREGTQNQPILYVRDGVRGADRVLLDPNALAADGTVALDWSFPSPDGKLLAYGTSAGGDEMSTLRVRDVATGQDLPDVIERTRACSLAWLPDASGFFYTKYPAPGSVPEGEDRYYRKTYIHHLGNPVTSDPLVFGDGRPKEDWPNIALSPNGKWLVVTQQQGWAKTEVYFAPVQGGTAGAFKPLVEQEDAIFEVDVADDAFYVRTNDHAPRYKLLKVDPGNPGRANWREILPESADVLEKVSVVGQTLATVSMAKASSRLRLHDLEGKLKKDVALPTLGTVPALGGEHDGKELYYSFQSFTAPTTVFRIDLQTLAQETWGQVEADIPFGDYEVRQVEYKSKDGTPISMFLAGKKGLPKSPATPTILYGYGGFNISLTPSFSAARFAFLERGGLLAIANLRGGGEYGEQWHQSGMLGKKQNVFDDFIAAGEYLVGEGYTSRDHLAIQGGSNGGLLVGAALTQRPDLFKAVVCQVPLLDMVRYHKFLIARLWIPEYGSADNAADYGWIVKYSPYHHVKAGTKYPATLIATADGDSRVDPLHARKMAALLQHSTAGPGPILLRLEAKAGHGAGKPRSKQLDEITDIYGFLFHQLGVK